ncbi:MAG: acyl carrier protein [Ruminococcus sp.]|nr:acyl carrier protein [Ruminococcus sp.]
MANFANRNIEEEVRNMIFERLRIDYINKEDVDYDAPIFASFDSEGDGLGLDSVDALELVVGLKEDYGIEVSDEEMGIFQSISSIADYVRENGQE